jgi:hypothetical protein
MNTAATTYADSISFGGTSVPKVWNVAAPAYRSSSGGGRSLFGDAVLLLFLLTQCFDGVFTYVGVVTVGPHIEANPIITTLMTHLGQGTALMVAKSLAALLGIGLHLRQVHGAVALLAAFYILVAVLPWMVILFG